jgi:hypothetical protein
VPSALCYPGLRGLLCSDLTVIAREDCAELATTATDTRWADIQRLEGEQGHSPVSDRGPPAALVDLLEDLV